MCESFFNTDSDIYTHLENLMVMVKSIQIKHMIMMANRQVWP